MIKKLLIITAISLNVGTAQANDLFDFLEIDSVKKTQVAPADAAELLTLEPKESEMYPKVSPDGQSLLVLSSKHKDAWISRRSIENGDPLNTVTDDLAALASTNWLDAKNVSFLSSRTGILSVWQKPADSEGLMRRVVELNGKLKDVTVLSDGGVIATRLLRQGQDKHKATKHTDAFNNWDIAGTRNYIVHISSTGEEKRLSEGSNPSLSPNGKRVVFSMNIGRSTHLFMMDVDGSNLAQLTDARSVDVQPTWSADGKWIAFTSNRENVDLRKHNENQWDIWLISSDGKGLTQLTMDKARDGAPSVASNGFVYFHSDRKISKEVKGQHQVQGATGDFHIWKVKLPE